MYRATFRATKNGQLVTFDSDAETKDEAFRRGLEWGKREFGHVELVVYEQVFQGPRIHNVRRFEYDPIARRHDLVWSNGYYVSEAAIR